MVLCSQSRGLCRRINYHCITVRPGANMCASTGDLREPCGPLDHWFWLATSNRSENINSHIESTSITCKILAHLLRRNTLLNIEYWKATGVRVRPRTLPLAGPASDLIVPTSDRPRGLRSLPPQLSPDSNHYSHLNQSS